MRQRRKRKIIALIISAMMLFIIISADSQVRPIIKAVSENKSERMSTIALNEAIAEEMEKIEADYTSLVNITYGNDGSVKSLQTDIVKLNILKADITNNASNKISSYTSDDINISIGSLLNSDLLSGRGPKIKIKLQMSSNAISNVESVFESAGINQTRHKINLHFTFSVYTIITGYNSAIDVDTTITIAETIIVGTTPDNFTEIDGNATEDDLEYLYNFKAED